MILTGTVVDVRWGAWSKAFEGLPHREKKPTRTFELCVYHWSALCASWFKNMATGLNRPLSASDARADDDRRSNRSTPAHRFCHSAIFRPITPYYVWFFWVSRHRSIILAKKMETFSGRFWETPGNVLKLDYWKCSLITKTPRYSSKQSLESFHSVFFFQMNPIPMRKKQLLSIRSLRF